MGDERKAMVDGRVRIRIYDVAHRKRNRPVRCRSHRTKILEKKWCWATSELQLAV